MIRWLIERIQLIWFEDKANRQDEIRAMWSVSDWETCYLAECRIIGVKQVNTNAEQLQLTS